MHSQVVSVAATAATWSESTYGLPVGILLSSTAVKWEHGQLRCGEPVSTVWRAPGPMPVAATHLGFEGWVSALVPFSFVLSPVTGGCWGFNMQSFLAKNT